MALGKWELAAHRSSRLSLVLDCPGEVGAGGQRESETYADVTDRSAPRSSASALLMLWVRQ